MYKNIVANIAAQLFVKNQGNPPTMEELKTIIQYAKGVEKQTDKALEELKGDTKAAALANSESIFKVFSGSPKHYLNDPVNIEPTLGRALRWIEQQTGKAINRDTINYNITREDYQWLCRVKGDEGTILPYFVMVEWVDSNETAKNKLDAALDPKVAEEIGVSDAIHSQTPQPAAEPAPAPEVPETKAEAKEPTAAEIKPPAKPQSRQAKLKDEIVAKAKAQTKTRSLPSERKPKVSKAKAAAPAS